jgi:hypothetical protein
LVPNEELESLNAKMHVSRGGQLTRYGDPHGVLAETKAGLDQVVRERAYLLWEQAGRLRRRLLASSAASALPRTRLRDVGAGGLSGGQGGRALASDARFLRRADASSILSAGAYCPWLRLQQVSRQVLTNGPRRKLLRRSAFFQNLINRRAFVGWSNPEGTRPHLGALLLGHYTTTARSSTPAAWAQGCLTRSLPIWGAAWAAKSR